MAPKTPNLQTEVPEFNKDCKSCLTMALQIQKIVQVVGEYIGASKARDDKLDELIAEVRVANQVKEVQDKILFAMYGDGTDENIGFIRKQDLIYNALFVGAGTPDDPGIIVMVHKDNGRLNKAWDLFFGWKWFWGTCGGVLILTFLAMVTHLYQSNALNIAKILSAVGGSGP